MASSTLTPFSISPSLHGHRGRHHSPFTFRPPTAPATFPSHVLSSRRSDGRLRHTSAAPFSAAALGMLSEGEVVSVHAKDEPVESKIPSRPGIYGVYDKAGVLQFIGISRDVAASVARHRSSVPDLCGSVRFETVDDYDSSVLLNAWKSWMDEHLAATGKVPPGNETGNTTWMKPAQRKPDLRLTPGRHVQLKLPLEELIDKLVKENEVVAFIKGSRYAPQCGFSYKVVSILESHDVDYQCLDVLDEEYNYGLREALKSYSNWPTFPQVYVGGQFIGGCDILSALQEKGELSKLFEK